MTGPRVRVIPAARAAPILMPMMALLSFCSATPSAGSQAYNGTSNPVSVRCANGRSFTVRVGKHHATIALEDGRRLRLHRRVSSLGRQYDTRDASLIIDGDFVAFVMKDDLGHNDGHLVKPQ